MNHCVVYLHLCKLGLGEGNLDGETGRRRCAQSRTTIIILARHGKTWNKNNKSHSLFTSRLISFLLSFILSYPFSSVAYLLPSFLGCLFANMVCVLPSFIPSFLHSSSFHRFDSLINFDHPPLPAMRGSQTTMDTARQHPLPRAPPGCSRACAWPAKWSNNTHGIGWICRTPMANRSWGSVETWNERNVGGCGVLLDLKLWCLMRSKTSEQNVKL